MSWAESNASRRGLLGQLAGQFTEMAKMKQAKRQNTQDILAGYGQQALGVLGQQQLETQRQAGESALAGEKHGYQIQEDISRITNQSRADQDYLEKQIKEMYSQQPEWQQQAELDRVLAEWKASGLSAREFWMGYAPVGGKEEDPMALLRTPSVYAANRFTEFLRATNNLDPSGMMLRPMTEEEKKEFVKDSMDWLSSDYPDMPDWEKASFKVAFMAYANGLTPGEIIPGAGEGGPGFGGALRGAVGALGSGAGGETALDRKARNDQMMALIPKLREKQATLDKKDPSYEAITRLLAQTLRGQGLLFSTEWDSWLKQAQAIVEPGERLYNLR